MITAEEVTRAADGAYDALALIDLAKLSVDMFTSEDSIHQNQVLGACFRALCVAREKVSEAADALDLIEYRGFSVDGRESA